MKILSKINPYLNFFIVVLSAVLFFQSAFAKVPSDFEMKKNWTDREIIDLGYVPDEVVVTFKKDKIDLKQSNSENKLDTFIQNNAEVIGDKVINKMSKPDELDATKIDQLKNNFLREKDRLDFANVAVFELPIDNAVNETIEELKNNPNVESVTPNYVFELLTAPDDPYYNPATGTKQWGLEKIDIEDAWDKMPEDPANVVVAVLDSGISYDHPDLSGNMWSPSGDCKDENNETIAGGCPNYGWDFVHEDNNPIDDVGHGTHVTGIIGAVTNNATGIAGITQNAKIMAVKIANSYGAITDIIKGIQFAKNNGAQIINASFGIDRKIDDIVAISDFLDDNHLWVASAGNEAADNDAIDHYPSNYDFDEIISVAASTASDTLVYIGSGNGSNWGATKVDIAAPGYDINSTCINATTSLSENFDVDLGDMSKDASNPNYWGIDSAVDIMGITGTVSFLSVDTNADTLDNGYPNRNYTSNQDYSLLTPSFDFSSSVAQTAMLRFDAWCDTEPQGNKGSVPDYVEVQVYDGSNWHVLETIDEASLAADINNQNILYYSVNGYNGVRYDGKEIIVPDAYMSSSTQFKLRWVSDSTNLDAEGQNESYAGCIFDDMSVIHVIGDTYKVKWGTSMAAPFVTGVAAMIWGKYPELTAKQVKEIIMDSGDDISTENPTKPTVSNARLNAYEAMLEAERVINAQIEPTLIESTAVGGYWTTGSTWVEGVVPTATSSVKLNGNVILNTNATVVDMEIASGVTFKNSSSANYTLTVNGYLVNNGTVQNNSKFLSLVVGGNVVNNGTLDNNFLTVYGDMENSGSLSVNSYLYGDLAHSGTHDAYIYMMGASTKSLTASTPLYRMYVRDRDVAATGNVTFTDYLEVSPGKTLTFGTENTLTASGSLGILNQGTIEGGEVIMSGGNQNFFSSGIFDADVTFSGTGIKSVQTTTITGDLSIGENAIMQNNYASSYTFTVNGNLVNDGVIQNSATRLLALQISGDVDNNGTLDNYYLSVYGDMENSGLLSVNTYLYGDLEHSGIHDTNIYMKGTSTKSLTASTPLYRMYVQEGDVAATGNVVFTDYLEISSDKTFAFGTENTLTATGTLGISNAGTIEGGTIVMSGGNQDFIGNGNFYADVLFGGTGVKSVQASTITGNLFIGENAIMQNHYSNSYALTINGNLVNDGVIQNSATRLLYLKISGDIDNNGTMTNYITYVEWNEDPYSYTYDIRFKESGYDWADPISTGFNRFYNVNSKLSGSYEWQVRSVVGGIPGSWSSSHYIN